MLLYIQNPKYFTKKFLEVITTLVADYKINIQKLVAFLYTNNELLGKNKHCIKKIKYLWINLTMEVKDLYSEIYGIDESNWRAQK